VKKILIVEDEKTLSDILAEKLEEEGFATEKALDGQQAIDYFAGKQSCDLILLDILLPKVDGFTALQKINDMGVKVPVIVFSNFLHDEEEEKAKQLGAKAFLVKAAFSTAEVVTKIKEVLGEE